MKLIHNVHYVNSAGIPTYSLKGSFGEPAAGFTGYRLCRRPLQLGYSLAGWLAGWLVSWLDGWLAGWAGWVGFSWFFIDFDGFSGIWCHKVLGPGGNLRNKLWPL